jgi:hypothetical protein
MKINHAIMANLDSFAQASSVDVIGKANEANKDEKISLDIFRHRILGCKLVNHFLLC